MEPNIFTFRLRMERPLVVNVLEHPEGPASWLQLLFTRTIDSKIKRLPPETVLDTEAHYRDYQVGIVKRLEQVRDCLFAEVNDEFLFWGFEIPNNHKLFEERNDYGMRIWLRDMIESIVLQSIIQDVLFRSLKDLVQNDGEHSGAMKSDLAFVKALQHTLQQVSMYVLDNPIMMIEGEFN